MYLSKARSAIASPPFPLLSGFKFVFSEVGKAFFGGKPPFLPLFCSSLASLQPGKKRAVGLRRKTVGAAACLGEGKEGGASELLLLGC